MPPKAAPPPPEPEDDGESERPLSEELMSDGLSNMGRIVDGTGFAFRTANCSAKRLGVLKAIEGYPHLQNLDLSKNMIKDAAPLKGLQFLLTLNLAENSIVNLKSWDNSEDPVFPNLVRLDLSGNTLTALPVLPKALRHLRIAKNEIASCESFEGHATLESFDISENNLKSLDGFKAMPALTQLVVTGNQLENANGMAELTALSDLILSKNKFEALEGPWGDLATLKSLDVSSCLLASTKPLEVLRQLPLLRSLATKGNPFHDTLGRSARTELLICHWRLTTIDGSAVAESEREQAREINVQRLTEEQARQKAEAEAAAAAAAEE